MVKHTQSKKHLLIKEIQELKNRVSFLEHESFGNFKQIEGTIIKRNGGIFETQFTQLDKVLLTLKKQKK